MPLPRASLLAVHAVFQLPAVVQRDPASDEKFIEAVRDEFPNVLARQFLPPEMPPQMPHLTLASSSSQLAVSSVQMDFEVRFYGEYLNDLDRGFEYVEKKLRTLLAGLDAMGVAATSIGLIGTLHFSLRDSDINPVQHLLAHHLRTPANPEDVQDAQAKVAVRVADKYFVNLTLGNYESRSFHRPIMPNMPMPVRIRHWEGQVDDIGLELIVDINNNLEAQVNRADPTVTLDGVAAACDLLRNVALRSGPRFVETAEIAPADLLAGSEA